MSESFVGEIRMFGGTFAPQDWAFCNGQLLSIVDYQSLYALIGTTYGGDGQSTFGLPNLQGRLPVHPGPGLTYGTIGGGSETVTLQGNQLPSHTHPYQATTAGAGTNSPSGALPAMTGSPTYVTPTGAPSAVMDPQGIGQAGGNQPHSNMMPYLAVSFIISLFGVYPTQS